MRKIKKVKIFLVSAGCLLSLLLMNTQAAWAYSTEELYSEIDDNGTIIDGNEKAIKFDKPVIRPTYLGNDYFKDYTGPDGKFEGVWEEKGPSYSPAYYGQEILAGKPTIIRNVGFYNNRPLALRINHTTASPSWTQKVTLRDDGGLAISPQEYGTEYQLVYNDGQFKTEVEDVYVEIPILGQTTPKNNNFNTYSSVSIKTDNLKRYVFHEAGVNVIDTVVSRKTHSFRQGVDGSLYNAEALHVEYRFTNESIGGNIKDIENTVIFDNRKPLVFANEIVLNMLTADVLFKSDLKTPGEISYLPPRTNGVKNTEKLETIFSVTQGLNDGFPQYFPETLVIVMEDHEEMFEQLNLAGIEFLDQSGKDISKKVTIVKISDHKYEFQVLKKDLISLGSNQININIRADNLNPEKILKKYNAEKNVYEVPVTFYNYKIYNGQKTESDKMLTVSEITPNLYGEANEGVKVDQYTYSGDLNVNDLLKNVATTIPGDTLKIELVDADVYFDVVKTYQVGVKISSEITNKNKIVQVPVEIIKAIPVTSEFFEYQTWLINYLNNELAPKKIDKDLYMTDLLKVKKIIDTDETQPVTKGEYIPKNISALANLEIIELVDKKLSGNLPKELGLLSKLEKLTIQKNQLVDEIPKELGNLKQLVELNLSYNRLTGKIPTKLNEIPTLKYLLLSDNQLVGMIPEFPADSLLEYQVSQNQVTYNANQPPSFIKTMQYGNTLIVSKNNLLLSGVKNIPITDEQTVIKPFDSKDLGFFDLHLINSGNNQRVGLFEQHRFIIKSLLTEEIVYQGLANKDVSFKGKVGETFQVILDEALNNPNNVFTVEGKMREVKLNEYPRTFKLKLEIGNLSKVPVTLTKEEHLQIFDNRIDSKWELKAKTSEMKNKQHTLNGDFYYQGNEGPIHKLSTTGYTTVESGDSQPSTEMINLSDNWHDNQGLFYQQAKASNYKGDYSGKIYWQLFDGPTIP